jgi:CHAT domain-containing protein
LKSFAFIAIALCGYATACSQDTKRSDVWPRAVEPRLTGASIWRPCPTPECGAAKTKSADCDEVITTDHDAVRILATQPACTDSAVDALERLARSDPNALSDLAAAYYLRAARQDEPVDLLRSLDAAEHAVNAQPRSANARFNRALAEEALGLSDDAIASWNELAQSKDGSEWTAEAASHRDRLRRNNASNAAEQWDRSAAQIPSALRAHNTTLLARLIAPFPFRAEKYFDTAAQGRLKTLDELKTFAGVLATRIGDRFATDTIAAMENNASNGPLELYARLHDAAAKPGTAQFEAIEQEALKRGYQHFIGPIRELRGLRLIYQSQYMAALDDYDAALAEYTRINDAEEIANAHTRRIGILRAIGQNELAWREAMATIRELPHIVAPHERHNLLGETAKTALALGHPDVALRYQNAAYHLLQKTLTALPPENLKGISDMEVNLAVALRERAGIQLHREQFDEAQRDLAESARLNATIDIGGADRRVLQARIAEVRGAALLHTDPNRAAGEFTSALQLSSKDYSTFRASLLAQRADALRLAGKSGEAERDLQEALDVLRAEESRTVEQRQRGAGEDLWSSYFARFQETYRLLIRQLIDEYKFADAFKYAERARAAEPLDLAEPADALRGDVDLPALQASLAPGTYLFEYSLLADRTIVWIISRDRFEVRTEKARRSDVERSIDALQRAARAHNASELQARGLTLYDALVAAPLEAIATKPARLVFIPDGPMHALPFAALRNGRTRRYLIEEAPIETAGSARLYQLSLDRDRALSANTRALLIGDPAFNPHLTVAQGIHPLPGARQEVETIGNLYAPNVETRVGAAATVPQFLDLVRGSAIVHVAAHTMVNARAPSRSLILLAPSPNDSGVLDARELLTRLGKLDQTRLVVLSTCSSAGGLPIGPEGVAPLVRPLIGAGVPAVIGSLWNVSDATAEPLLVSFHRHYRQGSDAAVALQSAQVELLRSPNPGLGSVMAWAPFQVIGHASSPFAASKDEHKEKPP